MANKNLTKNQSGKQETIKKNTLHYHFLVSVRMLVIKMENKREKRISARTILYISLYLAVLFLLIRMITKLDKQDANNSHFPDTTEQILLSNDFSP
ncbi:MAG: hypothetical protein K9H58_17380 [Bacteroidales bacterium]|nr:hypothetical protein [Bacteroidales bacterium]